MADLSSAVSIVQSPTCTICCERNQKKQIAVQTSRSGIVKNVNCAINLLQLRATYRPSTQVIML